MSKHFFRDFFTRIGSKYDFSADRRMLYKQILKYQKSAPGMEKQVRDMLKANYALRKKYGSRFKIVSLGSSCLPRTLATFTMLKAGKKSGEKSMPFDLALTPPKALARYLRTDFRDFFSERAFFDTEKGCWVSDDPADGLSFYHDKDCGINEFKKLTARYSARIENFREALNFPGPVLFLAHKMTHLLFKETISYSPCEYEEVFREIKKIRGNKPFKILFFVCDHNDTTTGIEGAEFIHLLWPDAKYIWHHEERHTPEGVRFEMAFAENCRKALLALLEENKGYLY